jgi:cyclopropane fatty-acyl-phospholipid synthase-like methyltransferase
MAIAADHALADSALPWCRYCAPDGTLPSAGERLERFTQWTMRQEGLDHDVARVKALAYMRTMPAWRDAFPKGDPTHTH